jgi:hypothetical protein
LGKEQFWRKALARFSDSGKSRAQFCADEGLKADVFVYWSKAILQRDAEVKQRNTPAAQNAQQVFVPVNMTAGTNQQLARPQKVVWRRQIWSTDVDSHAQGRTSRRCP